VNALRIPLAVIGAGPAGLEAAATAAEHGVESVLIDARERAGGQYYRQPPAAFSTRDPSRHQREADALARRAAHPLVRHIPDTVVWGVFPHTDGWELALASPAGVASAIARFLVLAAGAYDRPVPFPGWTLPGVMAAGGVQGLIKTQRVLPGKRFLLSGTGPLQLAVAAGLVRAGGEVIAVLEGAHLDWHMLRHAASAWGQWGRLAEGWDYVRALRSARVPVRMGWSVVAAHGTDQVEAATIARLDSDWRPIAGTEQRIEVDTIVTGYGFIPSTELSRLVGCEHVYRPAQGGLAPVRDENLLTCKPGIYIAGDAGGISGAAAARLEGRLAALGVCRQLGRERANEAAVSHTRSQLRRERRVARSLAALFTPGDGLDTLADNDTLLCRCESVTLGEVRKTVHGGARTVNEVKGLTCWGMGNCQARICGTLLPRFVARELASLGYPVPADRDLPSARPPVHPLPLTLLSQYESPEANAVPALAETAQ
jgi:D-hydroxyproline dehydrogenase subunit alpha